MVPRQTRYLDKDELALSDGETRYLPDGQLALS